MAQTNLKSTTVLVFGVFDRLHDGHRFFLTEAQKLASRLVIVVTPDEAVITLKGRAPREPMSVRCEAVATAVPLATVVSGDAISGSWGILEEIQPDVIALGYDQEGLEKALKNYFSSRENPPAIIKITDHRGGELHTSLLHP